jgi:hypothetical protein
MKKIILLLAVIMTFAACSSNDDGEALALEEINQTEWEYIDEDGLEYYIYFSVDNIMRIHHPIYVINTGQFDEIIINGQFTYSNPNVTLSFSGKCSEEGFIFSSCNVTAKISGTKLIVNDNGKKYTFTNLYPNE